MRYDRNAPCPCGSGKKYKKCCGGETPSRPDSLTINREVAYIGQVGRLRAQFCRDYIATKKEAIHNIEQGLSRDADALGRPITCYKGCGECCETYFISASLQECEAIVYWLYQHPDILRHFLQAMQGWQERVAEAADSFNTIIRLYGKSILSQITPEEEPIFRAAMNDYEAQHITCPCLVDGACSIYEVRPYVCAGVVSVSPTEWCRQTHPDHLKMHYLKTEIPWSQDMPYFVQPQSGILFASMPQLVNDLLIRGYAALADIPGLEMLPQAVVNDPEIQAAVAGLRYGTGGYAGH